LSRVLATVIFQFTWGN